MGKNVCVSDTQNNQVVMVPNENGTLNGTDMIVLSISGLGSPHGIAVDGNGNLYVADVTNGDVVEVPTGGGTPVMVAQGLTGPHGVAVDAGGNVYVATNNAVTEYPFGGGTAVPIGSGYSNPRGLAVDAAGNVYVADTGNGRIVEVSAGGASQSIFAITGLTAPQSVSLDAADNLYVTDSGNVYELNRTQAALAFSPTSIGSTSTAQTITVSNNGNQALTVSNLAITANFTQGSSGGTDCSSSTNLSPGGQCLIAVAFTPMQSGVLTGTLTLTDNALNNPASMQSVLLSGSGLQLAQMITFTANAPVTAPYKQLYSGGHHQLKPASCLHERGSMYELWRNVHHDEWYGDMHGNRESPGNGNYSPAPQVTQTASLRPPKPDDHVHEQCACECALQQQLYSGGRCQFRFDGCLYECGSVHELGRDIHDDEQRGEVHGNRESAERATVATLLHPKPLNPAQLRWRPRRSRSRPMHRRAQHTRVTSPLRQLPVPVWRSFTRVRVPATTRARRTR